MSLAHFRWFQVVLDRFTSFQLVPHFSKYLQIYNIVLGGILYDDIMSELPEIWKYFAI